MLRYLSNFALNTVAFLLFLFLIIFLQFRGTSTDSFYLDDIQFILDKHLVEKKYEIKNIKIKARGLILNVSNEDLSRLSLQFINSYKRENSIVYFYFNDNKHFLKFSLDNEKNFLVESNNQTKFTIPYTLDFNYKLELSENQVQFGEILSKIDFSPSLNFNSQSLVFSNKDFLKISKPQREKVKKVENLDNLGVFTREFNVISQENYSRAIKAFQNNAYNNWLGERLDSSQGWRISRDIVFDENLLIYLLAESLERGTYDEVLTLLKPLIEQKRESLSIFSFGYLADISRDEVIVKFQNDNKNYIANLEPLELNNNLLNDSKFLLKVFLVSDYNKYLESEKILKSFVLLNNKLSNNELINLLNNYYNYFKSINFKTDIRREFLARLKDILESKFSLVNGNLYVLNEKGIKNTTISLKLGGLLSLFLRAFQDNSYLSNVYKNIINSSLKDFNSNIINYEELYPYLSLNKFLPKVISSASLSFGTWIYTVADIVSFSFEQDYILDFNYTIGFSHYFIFNNIPLPSQVNFRNINWRSDAQFYLYTDGWKYLSKDNFMILKILQANRNQVIKLSFE